MAGKLVCLALAILATAAYAAPESRIVGGTPTTIEEFPYIVALLYHYPGPGITVQRCVGGLVSSYHILTTAHCFEGADLRQMLVRAGSTHSLSGGVLSTVREVIKHPNYVETPRQNDIAVLILNFPFGLSSTINMLFLPPQNWYITDGQPVKIVSWGFESELGPQIEFLKTVTLNKLPLDYCQAIYADDENIIIDDPVICASQPGPIGMCLGDSGAPMVIDSVVVGISSYYFGCGNDAYPDVFTRVDRHTDWILEVATAPITSADNLSKSADTTGQIVMTPTLAKGL